MKNIKALTICLALTILLCSCKNSPNNNAGLNSSNSSKTLSSSNNSSNVEKDQATENKILPQKNSSPENKDLTLYKEREFEFVKGEKGYIKIYTSALKDSDGEFMWDDGQKFSVEVFDGSNYYTILPLTYIQLGNVSFEVFDDLNDLNKTTSKIILNISTQAGLTEQLFEFSFDENSKENIFLSQKIYEFSNINNYYKD